MRFPVTRRLYAQLTGNDPGWPEGEADDRPINNVSWFDAVAFCNRLSEQEGLRSCYCIKRNNVSWDRTADGYRLPTEAEWEYACRAGTTSRWSWGDDAARMSEFAWAEENSLGQPRPVGQKKPNPWGRYDLHGNVWEWCWDRYGRYDTDPQSDPDGPPGGWRRVLRGGSCFFASRFLRSALRNQKRPGFRGRYVGFRCVRAAGRLD